MKNVRGFTLLELLIVIAIIAILSVILILVLDPAETLKKSRDSQRVADLNTVKTALGIFSTTTSTVNLASATTSVGCKTGTGGGSYAGSNKIWFSVNTSSLITDGVIDGGSSGNPTSTQSSGPSSTLTDGSGWLPVNLDQLIGGSPISGYPLDPTNSFASAAAIANTDKMYRYECNASTTKWEVDSVLESNTYTVQDNKMSKDGGNNANYYEVGTDVKLLGSGVDF